MERAAHRAPIPGCGFDREFDREFDHDFRSEERLCKLGSMAPATSQP
jgi:hypothetical protein